MKLKLLPNGITGRGSQAGSVILEAMIAILIFSIGILGLIGMQSTAINTVSDAKYRADASFFAEQLIGQMWASRVSATVAGITTYGVDPTYTFPASGVAPNALVLNWAGQSGVAGYLPQGAASVVISAVNPQQVTVMVSWMPPKATVAHRHTAIAYIE